MRLYSNNLSIIAIISSLITLEFFPACFSCSNNANLSPNSSGSDGKIIVLGIPEAEIIEPGDLSNSISVLSQVDLFP